MNKRIYFITSIFVFLFIFSCYLEKKSRRFTTLEKAPSSDTVKLPFTFNLPAGWRQEKASGFRVINLISDRNLVLSLSMLAGKGGGLEANFTRWLKQIGAKQALKDLDKRVVYRETNPHNVTYSVLNTVSMDETLSQAVIANIFYLDDKSWFFKTLENSELVQAHQQEILQIFKSIKIVKK